MYPPNRLRFPGQGEQELVLAAQSGDPAARSDLVEGSLPLIGSIARRYRHTTIGYDELMQEGVVGLLRALERFDPGRETPFWAYARWWVRQAMQKLVAELAGPMVLPDRALRRLSRMKESQREYRQSHGAERSVAELASAMGVTRGQIDSLIAAVRRPRGLDERVDEDASRMVGDRLTDPRAQDEYERVESRMASEALIPLPGGLCERERNILRAHYGLDRPKQTLREIAGTLQLSVERVRQIEARALGKLRAVAARAV